MAAQEAIGDREERAGRRLIEQIATILKSLGDDMPAGFGTALFGQIGRAHV